MTTVYLRNCWYMAGWAWDVKSKPLARTFLDEPVVLWRDEAGAISAIRDRCPHRFVPLSRGAVFGNALECAYHGLRFDGMGRCVHNPQGEPPKGAALKSYPVVERHSMIWIWMGDAALADPATIPDYSCNDPEDHHVRGDYLEMACDYRFATDNILDLSHIEFAHRDSLAPAFEGAIEQESAVRREGGDVWSDRCYIGIPARSGADGLAIDHWLNVRWTAPAAMLLCTGKAAHGAPRQDPDEGRHSHVFTPISATRSHYWFGVSRAVSRATIEQAEAELDRLRGPFRDEDLPMMAAQQEAFGNEDFWKACPLILAGDAGALRARRVLDQMIREQERGMADGDSETAEVG